MTSHSGHNDLKLRRHDLIFVSPVAWRSLMHTRHDLAEEPLLLGWVDRGWPLGARFLDPAAVATLRHASTLRFLFSRRDVEPTRPRV